ncbi:hypothetical protein [Pseudomonas phage Alpheus]|uniref:Uncharacterized protein n=1 Tax=Pseudomonas phage Alpheus TaxID=2163983 RepID=A0A2S1GMW8_9CAUD|nr:hypothetical protein HOT11_gp01 [Pseudomonas phage Alpheus]AWD90725.1 hypothetical protein [Pseudomonas phage Alpheus]
MGDYAMTYYLFKYGYAALFYSLLSACGVMALLTPIVVASLVILGVAA